MITRPYAARSSSIGTAWGGPLHTFLCLSSLPANGISLLGAASSALLLWRKAAMARYATWASANPMALGAEYLAPLSFWRYYVPSLHLTRSHHVVPCLQGQQASQSQLSCDWALQHSWPKKRTRLAALQPSKYIPSCSLSQDTTILLAVRPPSPDTDFTGIGIQMIGETSRGDLAGRQTSQEDCTVCYSHAK
jgi:hypothetical protein